MAPSVALSHTGCSQPQRTPTPRTRLLDSSLAARLTLHPISHASRMRTSAVSPLPLKLTLISVTRPS